MNLIMSKNLSKLLVRKMRRTYSRFLPVEVAARGASVTDVSSSSSGVLALLLSLLGLRLRSFVESLLLPRNRLPRSIVTYCKFRTLLCGQFYKAQQFYENLIEI